MPHTTTSYSEWDQTVRAAWDAYVRVHGGEGLPTKPEPRTVSADEWESMPDAKRLEAYLNRVKETPGRFERDATYQLYYLTELAIWLYKRLPRRFLARDSQRDEKPEESPVAFSTGGAPRSEKLLALVDKLIDLSNGPIADEPAVVRAQSHETPPPPPSWPPLE